MKRLVLFCLMPFFAACATPKFRQLDKTKAIEFSESWRDGYLRQDGEIIVPEEAYRHFAADPTTEAQVSSYHPWLYTGIGLAGAGGYFIGYDIFAKEKKNLWILGAGLIGLSFWPVTIAENQLKKAAGIHNQNLDFQRAKKRGPKLKANVVPIENGAIGTLQIAFD